MKRIFFTSLFLWPVLALSQNYAVTLYSGADGTLAGYPSCAVPIGTNALVYPPFTVMNAAELADRVATNQTAFTAWQSNQLRTISVNIDALVSSYSNLQWCAGHWDAVTNLANAKVALKAQGEVLLKLGPVLKSLYKGK